MHTTEEGNTAEHIPAGLSQASGWLHSWNHTPEAGVGGFWLKTTAASHVLKRVVTLSSPVVMERSSSVKTRDRELELPSAAAMADDVAVASSSGPRRRLLSFVRQLAPQPASSASASPELMRPGKAAMCVRIASSKSHDWGVYGDLGEAIETVELQDIPPGIH